MSTPESTAGVARHVVIVGGGTSGNVLARRLIDAGRRVTLIEAGARDLNPAIHDPSRMGELWHSPEDWDFFTVPQEHAGGRRLHLPRGRVLGGSHALNAMIWVRCAPEDFDGWAAAGCEGWAWSDVLPIYRAVEDSNHGPSELRGVGGLMPVRDDIPLQPIQAAIVEAAVEAGHPRNPDYNGESLDGISQEQVTIVDGVRVTSYTAYLRPVEDSPLLEVRTGAEVERVLLDHDADGGLVARGVVLVRNGVREELLADEVVLSAGALGSPAILQRSGIGAAETLRTAGIDPVLELPGVGENLHDHLLSPVIFSTEREIGGPPSGTSPTQTHLFWRSQPDLAVPDTQPLHFSVPMYQEGMTGPGDGFTLMSGIVTPKSRGSLRITGPSVDDEIAIDLAALSHPDDVASLVASVRQCREVGRRAALAGAPGDGGWGATELYPGSAVGDDNALLEEYVRNTAITYHHQVGTCAMGVGDDAVVDPQLRVRGVNALRVVDASIMPTVTTGNTNAPALIIGERAATFMLAEG
ncbi:MULTISPECIES: GMC family oxidoreductase [unclassified Leucobacter]|uniref:GMC family oxidoreductase n=1 Tax=unclassified Leucobacter TaxID=2621730 RepID=UPI00165E0E62|nr:MULTISPECIES: GMC family oxidoreductase N-terminal domain-containing protein [unclassified Leucobacter]MBC9937206.1 GMC family oxidoreductase N-terminal domain-containing protein [Leucobacter sp. cx-87]